MKKCSGVPLCNVFDGLTSDEKRCVLLQLRGFMDELRSLGPPKPGQVGSTEYGPFDDERLHGSALGPFENLGEFHKAIGGGFNYPTGHEECDEMIIAQNSRVYEIMFTHGDLAFRHVYYLDGKITGIIDWETAGWLPDYWEYAMAWDSCWDNPDLRKKSLHFCSPFQKSRRWNRLDEGLSVGCEPFRNAFEATEIGLPLGPFKNDLLPSHAARGCVAVQYLNFPPSSFFSTHALLLESILLH